ncbi:MAG: glycosyltransferase [Pseudomonadota bacterium]
MNNTTPLISIILPSYNRAGYVGETIESCLAQSYQNFELIIVDDFSRDNSTSVIEQYAFQDSRIKLIKNTVNKKLPATLNIGFREARGEYYTWISDDNLFAPNALEVMLAEIQKFLDIGLVYADYTTIDDGGSKVARIYQEPPEFLPIRDCVGACFLYSADAARQAGEYNEELFLIEDYEYFLRMGLITKMHHIPESLYLYRVHDGSLTKSRKEEIRLAKNRLKATFEGKYKIPGHLQHIYELYMWFIGKRDIWSYASLASIILKNPITLLAYILQNLRRLKS